MGSMIKSKREWRCTTCGAAQVRWEGTCRGCGNIDTLQEILLSPFKTRAVATQDQRKLIRRSKTSERNIAKSMVEADGRDPKYDTIATSTGRIGHITNIRVDAISRHYVTENKNRKMPTWLIDAWILISQKAVEFNKELLLHIDPPNMPKKFPINGTEEVLDTMAIITQTRHAALIKKERQLETLTLAIDKAVQAGDNTYGWLLELPDIK